MRPALHDIQAALTEVGRFREKPAGVVRLIAPPDRAGDAPESRLEKLARDYPEGIHLGEFLQGDMVVRVLEDWCPPFEGYFLYYPSRRHPPPALQALVEALRV